MTLRGIAVLARKGLVTRIVPIAGDSDFVPAAKHARSKAYGQL